MTVSTGFFYDDPIAYTVRPDSPLYNTYKRVYSIVQEWGPEGAMVEQRTTTVFPPSTAYGISGNSGKSGKNSRI